MQTVTWHLHYSQYVCDVLYLSETDQIGPSVRRRRRRPFTISNAFSSETAWPIKAIFYVEPPWEGGMKVYINGTGHMTKMAAVPIYGKNLYKSSS